MSNMLPELYPSIGDIEQLGVAYEIETNDTLEHEIYSIDVPNGDVVSITFKMTKNTIGISGFFATFEKADVFKNFGGVVTDRNQADVVVLRGSTTPADCYFKIVGTSVKIMCKNGIANQTKWKAVVAIIKV
jgi:ribosomal protein S17